MLLSKVSLASLRTFATVAHHGSLSLAAATLCISPSAVSHQMKLLEQQLDVNLFVRRSRGIELTSAGQTLAEHAVRAMHQLEEGLQHARHNSKQQLCIAAIPAFTQCWLIPRLQSFYDRHPHIELTIIEQDALVDFNQQAVDLNLHFGSGEFMGLKSELLMQEWAIPVCSPNLLSGFNPPTALLHDTKTRRLTYTGFTEDRPGGLSWAGWFNHANLNLNPEQAITHFNHLSPLYTAAKMGQGIALGWQQLIETSLKKTSLVAIGALRVPLKYSYYLVAPEHHFERNAVQHFLDWIREEIANS